MEPIQPVPDAPINFGYKTGWLALPDASPAEVAEELGLRNVVPANWEQGLEASYFAFDGSWFVTPQVDEWTLVVVKDLLKYEVAWKEDFGDRITELTQLLNRLSQRFSEAQFFFTHRVFEKHIAAKSMHGKLIRGFGCNDGGMLWEECERTPEEIAVGIHFGEERWIEDWKMFLPKFPHEDDIINLAALWSIDPMSLEGKQSTGQGLVGLP